MARFSRLEVLNTIVETGLVPVFYHPDVAVAKKIAEAVAAGGCHILEFTNRGDFAPLVFTELSQYLMKSSPQIILGGWRRFVCVGSAGSVAEREGPGDGGAVGCRAWDLVQETPGDITMVDEKAVLAEVKRAVARGGVRVTR